METRKISTKLKEENSSHMDEQCEEQISSMGILPKAKDRILSCEKLGGGALSF